MAPDILIVDDNRVNRKIIEKTADALYYNSRSADCAAAAFREFLQARPDLIVLDVHMPNMDGIEFARRLLEFDATSVSVPIIVVTGDTAISRSQFCMDNVAVLYKPLDIGKLTMALKDMLGQQAIAANG